MNAIERLLFHAPVRADICVITTRMVLFTTDNVFKRIISLATCAFAIGQIIWFLYRLTVIRSSTYLVMYGPIVFSCFFSCMSTIEIYVKQSDFRKILAFAKLHFMDENNAPITATNEINNKMTYNKFLILSVVSMAVISSLNFMPFEGLDFNDNLHPFMDFIGTLEIAHHFKVCLALLLYPFVFPLVYFMTSYGVVIGFFVSSLMTQITILKWKVIYITDAITETDSVTSILNNARKQESIREQIAACVKHHHNICRYIKMVQEYCYYTLSGQLFGVIVLLINFIYMILYVDTLGNHKLAIVTEFLNLAVGVYSYTYMGELFESQMCEILVACNQIKWYTFNSQNRKMFLIYIMNLRREYGLECLGLFAANLDICIWIFKKSFAVVSLLGALKNKAPNE